MPCQVCGAFSGRYPLCPPCNKERETGNVAKCGICARWSQVSSGLCKPCSERRIPVPGDEITGWAKRLYSTTMATRKAGAHREVVSLLQGVTDEVYQAMGAREAREPVTLEARVLYGWSVRLEDLATAGVSASENAGDTKAFLVATEIAERMEAALKAAPPVAENHRQLVPEVRQAPAVVQEPATRLVVDREIAKVVTRLIREAHEELLIISPWIKGVDNLVEDLLGIDKKVRVRIITRQPEKSDEGHRKTLHVLNHERVDFIFTPHVHAKIIVQDGKAALIGSANLVSTSLGRNQEAAVLTTEESVVADARDYFTSLYRAARAEMIG